MVASKVTSTGMSYCMSSIFTPTTFDTMRMPSSSAMTAMTGASRKPNGGGWRGTAQV
jgi:hypothetical protein